MPLGLFRCLEGHEREKFFHTREDLGTETVLCDCGHSMALALSMGRGLTWFSEKSPQTIWNLGPQPVVIRSPEEHRQRMQAAGVDYATEWWTQSRHRRRR